MPPDSLTESRLYTSADDIESLRQHSFFLSRQGTTEHLDFFLASLTNQWRPLLLLHYSGRDIKGVVYAKERRLLGFSTGTIYVDATLPNTILSEGLSRHELLLRSAQSLLAVPRAHSLRMIAPQDMASHLTASLAGLNSMHRPAKLHSILHLGTSYNELVNRLGPHSRRNIRYYRRRLEADGGRFVTDIPLEDFRTAASSILRQAGTGASAPKTNRFLNMVSAVRRPLLLGLQNERGEWISIVGAWQEHSSATVLFQMNNDRFYGRFSLGLVLRGYMLEEFIKRGISDVFFWAGITEPLSRIAVDVPAVNLYFDKPHLLPWLCRTAVKVCRPLLPPDLAWSADWIAPANMSKAASGDTDSL